MISMNHDEVTASIAAVEAHAAGAPVETLAKILAPVGMRARINRRGHLTITNKPTLGECIAEAFARKFA